MMKKIIALTLCLLMLVTFFASCSSGVNAENPGAYIKMYITDPVYNFDPARAYGNESALKIISLMFDNLFILNDNGKVEKSLAKSYKIVENEKADEYKMVITLHDSAWSDGIALTANDVVYAWKRILDPSNSFEAASLLYDIKYAREAKSGDKSIDDVRIYANGNEVEIYFVGKINYDKFLLNLTSYALAPIRENVVNLFQNEYDWAKKPTLFAASGPFKLREVTYEGEAAGLILERNARYLRDTTKKVSGEEKDALDKYVKSYRLIVDYTMTDEEIMQEYKDGKLFFVGDIPMSVRKDWAESKEVNKAKQSFSTHSYVLNQNALIREYSESGFAALSDGTSYVESKDGEQLFANPIVRQALSLAINRDEIVNTVFFAEAATGLVPTGVFNTDSKRQTFRENSEILVSSNIQDAKNLLQSNNIDATKYMFAISVPAYDDVHIAIAEKVQAAWTELGFHVALQKVELADNVHIDKTTGASVVGIKDDIFSERYAAGQFEVAAIDYTAFSVDAFSVLAPFAKGFTGGAASTMESPKFKIPTHVSGYDSDEYNNKIAEAYATTDDKEKAEKLHEAEEILMKDLPIIPVVFNINATLTSKELTGEKTTFYGTPIFTKLKLKNYEAHLPDDVKKQKETEEETTTEQ